MKRETTLAIAVGLAVILSACTTTKDLERRPQMVAVDSSGDPEEGKRLGRARQKGGIGNNSTANANGATEVQEPEAGKVGQSAEGEANARHSWEAKSQSNATSPGETRRNQKNQRRL